MLVLKSLAGGFEGQLRLVSYLRLVFASLLDAGNASRGVPSRHFQARFDIGTGLDDSNCTVVVTFTYQLTIFKDGAITKCLTL